MLPNQQSMSQTERACRGEPGLQLDVDLMILEYSLYQAVESQFRWLLDNNQDDNTFSQASLALSTFDCFIRVFHKQHPNRAQTPELDFRLDVLQFLVLLNSLVHHPVHNLSESMPEKLQQSTASDLQARRRWLAERERHFRRREKRPITAPVRAVDRDVEVQIFAAWSVPAISIPRIDSQETQALLLFSLLPRFMAISAKFLPVIDQTPSSDWMEVACQLMLRAGVESLRLQTQNRLTPDLPTLEDCFAWGYNASGALLNGNGATTVDEEPSDLINDLFRTSSNTTPSIREENSAWTKLRLETIHEFSIANDASTPSQSCRLERLADKYPLEDFQQKMVGTLHNIWELSCRDYIFGRPVLVEIEEGHLRSFGVEVGADFDAFAARVRLRGSVEKNDREHVVRRRVEKLDEGGTDVSSDVLVGFVTEERLSERYEQELLWYKPATKVDDSLSPEIKLEG